MRRLVALTGGSRLRLRTPRIGADGLVAARLAWLVVALPALGVCAASLPFSLDPSLDRPGSLYEVAAQTVIRAGLLLIALSIGMAILRSHLWDIDVLISRVVSSACSQGSSSSSVWSWSAT
jgi:hypothetical protein